MGRCNFDSLSPKQISNDEHMYQGFADEAVVVVKRQADNNYGDIV